MQPKRVLIVEDDVNLCLSLSDLLNEFGFDTAVAGDGVKALTELEMADPLPDLILLDLHMPNMDGWQLQERLQQDERYRCIPIIIMSADQACITVEAEGHLVKPFELSDFTQMVMQSVKKNKVAS